MTPVMFPSHRTPKCHCSGHQQNECMTQPQLILIRPLPSSRWRRHGGGLWDLTARNAHGSGMPAPGCPKAGAGCEGKLWTTAHGSLIGSGCCRSDPAPACLCQTPSSSTARVQSQQPGSFPSAALMTQLRVCVRPAGPPLGNTCQKTEHGCVPCELNAHSSVFQLMRGQTNVTKPHKGNHLSSKRMNFRCTV